MLVCFVRQGRWTAFIQLKKTIHRAATICGIFVQQFLHGQLFGELLTVSILDSRPSPSWTYIHACCWSRTVSLTQGGHG
jgi:hypothetical protein